jgi:uncharacterized UPF0160 family protein
MIPRSFGTHDGTFHADEVTACALLLVFDKIDFDKIRRTRDLKQLARCEFVCDVGAIYDPQVKRFDHHQVGYQGELSSAGMVLKYLKETGTIDAATYEFLNRSLVLGVDAHDIGKVKIEPGVCTFSQVISNFVPTEYEASAEEQFEAFAQAVRFAEGHLKRLLQRHRYIEACRLAVIEAMRPKERYLMFDKAMPWIDVFFDMGGENHPALFVVMPSGNHWKVRGIPPHSHDRMQVRKPLPEKWAGLMDRELKEVSGIPGAIFCHKGRFISVWETKEDALKALKYVLEEI